MGDGKLLKEMGIRIGERRRELRFTQELLAEKMDVSVQMISNLELGKKAIRPENLIKLCDVLGVSADYILRGSRSDGELHSFMEAFSALSYEKQRLLESIVATWK